MSSTAPAPTRHAPIALWRVAQAFLNTLYTLFGAPEDVAFQHTFTAKAHRELAQWLRCAEAMLRRLLLIEASAYPKPNTRPLLTPSRRRVRKLVEFTHDKPEAWRVSFRILDRRRLAGSQRRRCTSVAGGDAGGPSKNFRSAWPLAERYEALLRVFNDPTAYARRLARRLHATPHRLREALRAPQEATHRVEHFDAMTRQAETAWHPHFSSG